MDFCCLFSLFYDLHLWEDWNIPASDLQLFTRLSEPALIWAAATCYEGEKKEEKSNSHPRKWYRRKLISHCVLLMANTCVLKMSNMPPLKSNQRLREKEAVGCWNVAACSWTIQYHRAGKTNRRQNKRVVSEHHPQNETSPAPAANKWVGDSLI